MLRIYDRINVFRSHDKFNPEADRADGTVENLKRGNLCFQSSTFCRERLVTCFERILKEEEFFRKNEVSLCTTVVLKNSIKEWSEDDLQLLRKNLYAKIFSLAMLMDLKFVDYYIEGSRGKCLAWSISHPLLINPSFSTEKLSLVALILENEEACRAMLKDSWSTDICNLLVKLDKNNPLYFQGYLWSAIYLHIMSTRFVHSVRNSSGPSSTAKAIFKSEDLISFINIIEDKEYVKKSLTNEDHLNNKMFKITINAAIG